MNDKVDEIIISIGSLSKLRIPIHIVIDSLINFIERQKKLNAKNRTVLNKDYAKLFKLISVNFKEL